MLKLNLVLISIIVVGIGITGYYYNSFHEAKKDVARLQNNVKTLTDGVYSYKTKADNAVSRTRQLEVKVSEFENDKTNDRLKEKIKELDLKIKRIQSVGQVTSRIDTVLKEVPILYRDSCYSASNDYIDVTLCPSRNSLKVNLTDTTYTFISHDKIILNPSRYWLFRLFQSRTTVVNVDVTHSNKLVNTIDVKQQYLIR